MTEYHTVIRNWEFLSEIIRKIPSFLKEQKNRTCILNFIWNNVVFLTSKLTVPFIFNGRLCGLWQKKAKQAKLRLPLTYKRLIVWDIYGPLYVIGKRKQQGSSNFAPHQTSPRGIFSDDQSAFSIPLGINEKKAPRNTSSPDKHDCSDNLTSYIAFPCHNGS